MHDKCYSGYGFMEQTTKKDTNCNMIIHAKKILFAFPV